MDLLNLFKDSLPDLQSLSTVPGDGPTLPSEEQVDVLVEEGGLRIERIVSTGQASPPGFWYDQDEHEWVLLLAGRAGLLFEGEASPRLLEAGDQVLIPAHVRHRVEWTAKDEHTIWLAAFYPALEP